ncbi:hypothetical protein GF325_17115 [Candidatus Bathyarchaeota archaeon]|nr:hypothetical protein [Candidatus Bathyarchaeota archaeon]
MTSKYPSGRKKHPSFTRYRRRMVVLLSTLVGMGISVMGAMISFLEKPGAIRLKNYHWLDENSLGKEIDLITTILIAISIVLFLSIVVVHQPRARKARDDLLHPIASILMALGFSKKDDATGIAAGTWRRVNGNETDTSSGTSTEVTIFPKDDDGSMNGSWCTRVVFSIDPVNWESLHHYAPAFGFHGVTSPGLKGDVPVHVAFESFFSISRAHGHAFLLLSFLQRRFSLGP